MTVDDSGNIFIAQGESGWVTISPEIDGKSITGFVAILSVKKSCADTSYILQKSTFTGRIYLSETDTQDLSTGKYVYDVEVHVDEQYATIGPFDFILEYPETPAVVPSGRAENMKNHLLAQFTDKDVLYSIIDALGAEMDELDIVFDGLKNRRWIDTGEGVQLDGIGTIVGKSRQIQYAIQIPYFGFSDQPNALSFEVGRFRDIWEKWLSSVNLADPEYRLFLWQKIAKNSSIGTAEDTIKSLKFIFDDPIIILSENGNAKISVAIGRKLTANEISLAEAADLTIRAGGVGLLSQVYFYYDNYFGFLGQPNAKGFDIGEMADIF